MGFLEECITALIIISVIWFIGKFVFDKICYKYG